MKLTDLKPTPKSKRPSKRRGRGAATGQGGTAGRGHKGQLSRSGSKHRPGFEGGQLPLIRRLPKRGFTSRNHKTFQVVNVEQLNRFESGARIDPDALAGVGLVKHPAGIIKILGTGTLDRQLDVVADAFSRKAKEIIEQAGGTAKPREKAGSSSKC